MQLYVYLNNFGDPNVGHKVAKVKKIMMTVVVFTIIILLAETIFVLLGRFDKKFKKFLGFPYWTTSAILFIL